MSLETFGDEGNVAERWEDTAMRQEWDVLLELANKPLVCDAASPEQRDR